MEPYFEYLADSEDQYTTTLALSAVVAVWPEARVEQLTPPRVASMLCICLDTGDEFRITEAGEIGRFHQALSEYRDCAHVDPRPGTKTWVKEFKEARAEVKSMLDLENRRLPHPDDPRGVPKRPGPRSARVICPKCNHEFDLSGHRPTLS